MIIVVDGYNVLKRHHGVGFIDAPARHSFLHDVAAYARARGNKVVVVFDGDIPDDDHGHYGKSVQIIYSGSRETADDYIKRYLNNHKNKDLMLVTSDRELNARADTFDIPSLDAHEFVRVLVQYAHERSAGHVGTEAPLIKMSDEKIPELDELMAQASKMVPQKSEDVQIDRKSSAQKLSKKERALLKKVKKL